MTLQILKHKINIYARDLSTLRMISAEKIYESTITEREALMAIESYYSFTPLYLEGVLIGIK